MKLQLILAAAILLGVMPSVVRAEDRGTRDEAIAMVGEVTKFYKENGADATYKAILAHGAKPDMVGLNRLDATDQLVGGKKYIREFVDVAKSGTPGWVAYKFIDPITKNAMDKESYVQALDDKSLVGVGVYKQ
jgi:signal transduction histidine kinase